MDKEHLRFLCNQVQPGRGVLPMMGDLAQPLAAIYPIEAHADLVTALSGNDFSLRKLTNQLVRTGKLQTIRVPAKAHRYYRNINEPPDAAEQRGSRIGL
jgi:molybdopterin-guanine dinucleotide biosynthesis protein A